MGCCHFINHPVTRYLLNICVRVGLHLNGDVEHETWFPSVSHAHDSDPVGIAHTHLL